jgi:hypothetical protein
VVCTQQLREREAEWVCACCTWVVCAHEGSVLPPNRLLDVGAVENFLEFKRHSIMYKRFREEFKDCLKGIGGAGGLAEILELAALLPIHAGYLFESTGS